MGTNVDRRLIKRLMVLAVGGFTMIGFFASPSFGEEHGKVKWGFSILGGINGRPKPDLTHLGIFPRVDLALHRNWDLEFEGDFSYYTISGEKDLYLLGTNANLVFKPLQWNKGSWFILGGGGLAYTNSNGQIKEMADYHLAGITQSGTGINYELSKGHSLRLEYRFHHTSVPFKRDVGINTHNILLGITF